MCNLEDHNLLLISESPFRIAQFIITGPEPWLCRICLMLRQPSQFELPSLSFLPLFKEILSALRFYFMYLFNPIRSRYAEHQ